MEATVEFLHFTGVVLLNVTILTGLFVFWGCWWKCHRLWKWAEFTTNLLRQWKAVCLDDLCSGGGELADPQDPEDF